MRSGEVQRALGNLERLDSRKMNTIDSDLRVLSIYVVKSNRYQALGHFVAEFCPYALLGIYLKQLLTRAVSAKVRVAF